jgi:hypothetical protein
MTFPTHPERIWAAAFGLSWAIDLLFWHSNPGIAFTLWIALALAGLFLSAFWERKRVSWPSFLLGLVTLGLALTNSLRAEPFSRFFTSFLSLACLCLLAATLSNGNWLFYRVGDYILTGFSLIAAGVSAGAHNRKRPDIDLAEGQAPPRPKSIWQTLRLILPYLRGILFAIPVLSVLGLLLASADPLFSERMRSLLSIFDFSHLSEYVFRIFYIVFLGYVFCGLLLNAVVPSKPEPRPNPQEAWKLRYLGSTEAFIVLGTVVAMFGFFLVLQFHYLFGGQANISGTGYTYAEYARRGFFELVWVAILSIALYLGLGLITRRDTPAKQRAFSLLAILLLAMLLLILGSALQRLLLYEGAYGYTRLRTYTHIFIFWMMLLLLAAIVLEAVQRPGHFGLALLIFTLGFGLTFTFLNLDGLITNLNIQRDRAGKELDTAHLTGLSADAVPTLARIFNNPAESETLRLQSGAALACLQKRLSLTENLVDWRAYNLAEANAARIFNSLDLKAYSPNEPAGMDIKVNGQIINCWNSSD